MTRSRSITIVSADSGRLRDAHAVAGCGSRRPATFSGDQKPGDTNGQRVNAFGGLWYAVSPGGDQVTTQAPTSGSGY